MSLKSILARKSVKRGGAATVITGGVLALMLGLAPGTGAVFTDTGSGTANLNAATLDLDFGSAAATTFNVTFNNVKPGDNTFKTFTVRNNGTIAGDVTLHPRDLNVTKGTRPSAAQLALLTFHVEGYNPPSARAGVDDVTFNLGTLAPGEAKTYELYVNLDKDANNEWQGVGLVSNLDVTLTQH